MRQRPKLDPRGDGCLCQRCGKRYKVDFYVDDYLWEVIKPEGKPEGAGLLCGRCIADAIEVRDKFNYYTIINADPSEIKRAMRAEKIARELMQMLEDVLNDLAAVIAKAKEVLGDE